MKDVYIDLRGLEIKELFPDKDFISIEDLIDVMIGIYIDNKNKTEEIEDLKEYKNAYIDETLKHPYSYYGVSENDFR